MPTVDYKRRRERVFLVLAGVFLGTLSLLNILGISRFIDLSFEIFGVSVPMVVAVGVLPYPVTFICTDLISELYGRKRATEVVWVGLLLNVWVVFLLWIGGALPGFEAIDPETGALLADDAGRLPVFFEIRTLAFGAVTASIAESLARGDDVAIAGFGRFTRTHRAAREGRNPRTGERIAIGPSVGVSFKAGKALKDALN